jgi:hypothetical protein
MEITVSLKARKIEMKRQERTMIVTDNPLQKSRESGDFKTYKSYKERICQTERLKNMCRICNCYLWLTKLWE